ncbi:MAG: dioxygenase, partial [Deltaproteobacteria bacterium]
MALHRLTSITIGVPDVAATAAYYEDFGLMPARGGRFATADGGEQLALVAAARRRLVELGIGVDDVDDLERAAANLARVGGRVEREGSSVTTVDPGTQVRVVLRIAARIRQAAPAAPATNGPGHAGRPSARAAAVLRAGPVRPRKLGHVVLGSTDVGAS